MAAAQAGALGGMGDASAIVDPSCKSDTKDVDETSHKVPEEAPSSGGSPAVVRRATDELVHRLGGIPHLRRDLAAENGERPIEEPGLDEHRSLVPVDVLVR